MCFVATCLRSGRQKVPLHQVGVVEVGEFAQEIINMAVNVHEVNYRLLIYQTIRIKYHRHMYNPEYRITLYF